MADQDTGMGTLRFRVEGVSPLMLHNSRRFLDPGDELNKKLKKLTSKKKKTDQDYADIALLEWRMGVYYNDQGQPIIPGENTERMLVEAGKKARKGQSFIAGIICEDAILEYTGPTTVAELEKDPKFYDKRPVVIQRARIMRTRPIFNVWATEFVVQYIRDVLDADEVRTAMETAGKIIGTCDYRPKFGRFTATEIPAEVAVNA